MIGDSKEEGTRDTDMTMGVNTVMADRAVRMFPKLGRLNVVRTWTAIRVMTADGFPIYEQSESHPGAFVACCHSGVTLAANHALTVAPMIASGRSRSWPRRCLYCPEVRCFTGGMMACCARSL